MKYASVLLAVGCLVSAVHAQWLEETIYLPDSFGGLGRPRCMAYDPADNIVYVGGGDCVIAIDGATNQKIARIPNGSGGAALCYNPTNNKLYSASGNGVAIIDCATNTVIGTADSVGNPPCYNRRDNKVYCGNDHGRSLTVMDGATDVVIPTIGVGVNPTALAWNPAQSRVYVANFGSSSISVLRDSSGFVGMEGTFRPQAASSMPLATIIRGVLFLPGGENGDSPTERLRPTRRGTAPFSAPY